jgi:hypothetical protein
MTVPCTVSAAEMREAMRLNLTKSFWWKAAFGNARMLIYVAVLIAVVATKLKGDTSVQWQGVFVLVGVVVLLFAMYLGRLHREVTKKAKAINESCKSLAIDVQGISTEMADGSRAFTPWSAVNRWREGKLVFTIGDAKSFRVVSRDAIGEMQCGELRSMLMLQVRG